MTLEPVKQDINISTDVLVIGGGLTGLKTADQIADFGYNVTVIEKNNEAGCFFSGQEDLNSELSIVNKAKDNSKIEILTETVLVKSTGFAGDFNVSLSKDGKTTEKNVGAIVVATDFSVEPLNENFNVDLSENIVTQTEMESILSDSDKKKSVLEGKNKIVVFLTSFPKESNPLALQRILKSSLTIQDVEGSQVYVMVDNIKLASDGLDRLYKESRDKGVIFIKTEDSPEVTVNGEKTSIKFFDKILRSEATITSELVVIEENFSPDMINSGISELLSLDLDSGNFFQTDNVHRFPVKSNRVGVFVAGSARKIQPLSSNYTDAENAAIFVKDFLGNGTVSVSADYGVVDPDKCAICLTCYRSCAHGAIYWEGDAAIISPIACQGCGNCASECPMDAIQVGEYKDDIILEQVNKTLEGSEAESQIVAFCCQNSALEAAEMANDLDLGLPDNLKIIKVPCAGKVDVDYILKAFVNGAKGVMVLACHTGNCKSEFGNTFASWRVNNLKKSLDNIGINQDRLCFETVASNMGKSFQKIVQDMQDKIS